MTQCMEDQAPCRQKLAVVIDPYKQPFILKPASGTPITTMTAEVTVADASINQGTGKGLTRGR